MVLQYIEKRSLVVLHQPDRFLPGAARPTRASYREVQPQRCKKCWVVSYDVFRNDADERDGGLPRSSTGALSYAPAPPPRTLTVSIRARVPPSPLPKWELVWDRGAMTRGELDWQTFGNGNLHYDFPISSMSMHLSLFPCRGYSAERSARALFLLIFRVRTPNDLFAKIWALLSQGFGQV